MTSDPTTIGERSGGHLGEMLRSAREARGIDRAKVERDTRIRERHLSALERGAYDELPGDVYARGFLRAYAKYLDLDPDEVAARYRAEMRAAPIAAGPAGPTRRRPRRVPQPRAFVLAPGVLVAAVLTLLVGAFAAYLGYQVVTFARTPELRVLVPAGDVADHPASTILISGMTAPNARVSVTGAVVNPTILADGRGQFSVRVELVPGSNVIALSAFDPVTRRTSPEVTRRVEVVVGDDRGESVRPTPATDG